MDSILCIGIDELSRKKGHVYVTNVYDLDGRRLIWSPENLTDKQPGRLGYLEKLNLRTNRAYLLKEGFREFWNYWSKGWAKKFLSKWYWWATHSRLKPMRDFAWMLRRHQDGLLNYFE